MSHLHGLVRDVEASPGDIAGIGITERERVALVCGPDAFAAAAVEMLRAAGRERVIVL